MLDPEPEFRRASRNAWATLAFVCGLLVVLWTFSVCEQPGRVGPPPRGALS